MTLQNNLQQPEDPKYQSRMMLLILKIIKILNQDPILQSEEK